jgi:hypothetical protein
MVPGKLTLFSVNFQLFVKDIKQFIDTNQCLDPEYPLSPQIRWDELKDAVKQFTKSFQLDRNTWRCKSLKKLQSKRNRILRDCHNTAIFSSLLPIVDQMIASLREEIAEIEHLKAGKFWRENGEKSPGFLKRMVATRSNEVAYQLFSIQICSRLWFLFTNIYILQTSIYSRSGE